MQRLVMALLSARHQSKSVGQLCFSSAINAGPESVVHHQLQSDGSVPGRARNGKINIQSATTRGDWEVVYVMLPSVYFGISFESKNCPLLPSGTKRQCGPGQGESWRYSVSLGLP